MDVIYGLDMAGTFTFAISGFLSAAQKKFDLVGAFFTGFITAVGGGTIRDLLLGETPVFWIHDVNYTVIITAAILFSLIFKKHLIKLKKALFFFDTIGIGVFTVIGIEKAVNHGILPVFCVMMGIMTAVMGGIIRDVFCNDIPLILKKEIYATACMSGGILFFMLKYLGLPESYTVFFTGALVSGVRFLSVRYKLKLPRIKLKG